MNYTEIKLSNKELLIGFDYKGLPLTANMIESPHLLITGLSGQGKTGMVRCMIKNLINCGNTNIILLNAFMDDYRGFNLQYILNHGDIKELFKELLGVIEVGKKRTKPLYLIFEELGKVKDKELIDLTTKILQYGRHDNIFIIGIIQTATKEELKFKNLFNSRCTFKQLEESSYRVVLGCSIDEKLNKQEFYLYTNDLYRGKTYYLDF